MITTILITTITIRERVALIMRTLNVFKSLLFVVLLFTLSGCLKREIYTEIADKKVISHPPTSLEIKAPDGMLKTNFKTDPSSPIKLAVYIHRAKCTNAQSKSLGSDFDGYIRLTLSDHNRTIARAQMDYKGEVTNDEVQQVYDHLIQQLHW